MPGCHRVFITFLGSGDPYKAFIWHGHTGLGVDLSYSKIKIAICDFWWGFVLECYKEFWPMLTFSCWGKSHFGLIHHKIERNSKNVCGRQWMVDGSYLSTADDFSSSHKWMRRCGKGVSTAGRRDTTHSEAAAAAAAEAAGAVMGLSFLEETTEKKPWQLWTKTFEAKNTWSAASWIR